MSHVTCTVPDPEVGQATQKPILQHIKGIWTQCKETEIQCTILTT